MAAEAIARDVGRHPGSDSTWRTASTSVPRFRARQDASTSETHQRR